ncbi:alpha/beta fold hydrolase [Fusibacter sp. JL298sf-3]
MKLQTIKRSALAIIAVLLLSTLGFLIYAGIDYGPDEVAQRLLKEAPDIYSDGNLTLLPAGSKADTALIFYPGAKVEAAAYLPILNEIRATGITCILVDMPLNMAIFNSNAADDIFEKFPGIRHWYIGGHSMGGAMASAYASKYPEVVEGLILMGAYVYGDYPPADALTIYGTLNTTVADKIDYKENIVAIEGGNHAQFGNYGPQRGDAEATITREAQQRAAVDAIEAFVAERRH